ncbi:GNAT family N-acetyltransferase [Paenibacillus sp. LHD-117]|uniref:GNAT family N-acetyltransferase n=1 Tax=Paenibacillus sp. LHD-117 TaxID=3071412 RepID=UPI0027E0B064|nr:GNAT family N-acetyltransferase [Paenibacillus sp. LHD-117]MDQ6421747.1 GNAT family N-acetyltransferase [Paenibacillus sp. LHD-117]
MNIIRTITQEEAESFWALRLEALQTNPTVFGSSYEEALHTSAEVVKERLRCDGNQFVLGAYSGENRLVGMVGFKRETSIKAKHKSFIWGMYVTPSFRQHGIGRLLMEEALRRASAMHGLDLVLLSVVTSNEGARKLYHSLGFETYGTERCALKIGGVCYDEDHMVYWIPTLRAKDEV